MPRIASAAAKHYFLSHGGEDGVYCAHCQGTFQISLDQFISLHWNPHLVQSVLVPPAGECPFTSLLKHCSAQFLLVQTCMYRLGMYARSPASVSY